jgi:hypothetical protein
VEMMSEWAVIGVIEQLWLHALTRSDAASLQSFRCFLALGRVNGGELL